MISAYISISRSQRKMLEEALHAIVTTLARSGIVSFVFVDSHSFEDSQSAEMMDQAMKDIDQCDLLVAETSHKAIGIGVEAGYARAKGKPVIYLRQQDAEHSTTVAGISDFQVIYTNPADLKAQLSAAISEILKARESLA
jgi:2'-deoxynucleoside 5'-phosphate N-hydrolase